MLVSRKERNFEAEKLRRGCGSRGDRERDGEKIYQIFSEAVTINQGLTDDLFTLPGNIKILKPKRVP